MFEGFDAFENAPGDVEAHQAEHGAEAAERWGETGAYRESMRRITDFSNEEWKRIKEEGEAQEARMAALLKQGSDPRFAAHYDERAEDLASFVATAIRANSIGR